MMESEDDEEEDEAYLLKLSVEEVDYYNLECQSKKTEIDVDELGRFLNGALIGDNNFKNMYKKLPSGISATFEISQIPENRSKNRFKGYYPYDYNRVILEFLPDKPHSDFINASYVDGFESQNYFIAAQGPTKKTVNDFIRMIWEKKCDKIIMLTKTYEQRKYKCERYWPDNEKEVFGDYELVVEEEKTRCDYTVRKITMKMVGSRKSNRSHTFFHYHFTSWPDHDVPGKTQLLDFLYYTRKYSSQSSIIVHCSAGIGRTGTFIAVDALLKQGDKTHKVDVDKFIYRMRGQRKNMIQTPSQLKFLYEVLIEGFKYGDTSLSCETYVTGYTQHGSSLVMGKSSIEQQFNCLKPISDSTIRKKDHWFSLPSRKSSIGYSIIEEKQMDPLEFWKQVKSNGSHLVVQLSDESDVDFYPVSGSQTSIGLLEVKCESVVTITTDLSSTIVTVCGGEKRTCKGIKLLKMVIPHKDLASLFGNIMKILIDHVEMHDNGMVPIIVLTSQYVYGVIFCLLRNIIQRINIDDQVEVFNSVSVIRSICPSAFTSKSLYKDVHQFALEYITSMSDYANLKS
ncbi:receptor-type tyrosine-protein phosphatase epsilon [Patella vulgata]|uniref:receptor-type tyrosine-protein phosphatase epsilon n=1 Tax=Patella vulgata TaxID=6465 RepID=UPI0024A99BB7|nr:receptor-type tyrosine-protein phosphatase epsilon [Patella vulgata]